MTSDDRRSEKAAAGRLVPPSAAIGPLIGDPTRAARLRRPAHLVLIALCMLASWAPGCARQGTPAGAPARGEEKTLNVYIWSDYLAPDTVANFEKETGIRVRLDFYDNNEVLETKLLTGHSSYDVVTPSESYFDRQLKAGVYRKLDKARIPNLSHTDPDIMRRLAVHDPGNQYAIPYMWSTTGIGYNVERLRERLGSFPQSWSLLLDPRNAARLKDCGIAITDSPIDAFTSVIIAAGRDPNRHATEDLLDASARLQAIRPYVRLIEPNVIAPLANGEICIALGWSGDVEMARQRALQAGKGVHIEYFVPQEGALLLVDMVGIPADAPHPGNAELWMNYLLRPDVAASLTNYIRYPNGVLDSQALLAPGIASDPSIYPDAATRARLVTASALAADYTRLMNREWTRFRTGQ